MLTTLRDDVKVGLRSLLHDRGFALAAVLSIGLGVGANSALFSLVDQALLRMLPVRDPDRLVLLDWKGTFIGNGWGTSNLMSYPFYRDVRDETQVFDGVFARHPTGVDLMIDGTPERVNAEIVTGSYFPVLGVRPLLGRLLDESDDQQPNAHPVVVVSAAFWKNRLGGRADIVGMKVAINRHPMTVVGVADPQFHGIDWADVTAIWLTTMMKREATPEFDWLFDRRGKWLHVFGRLKPGATPEAARAQLQPWFKAMLQTDTTRDDWPQVTENQRQRYLASTLDVLPAARGRSDLRRQLERPLLVLLAATAFVLLWACLNVANLSLARGYARRRETALKLALGASRLRVAGGLLIQSAWIAVGGTVVGLLVAPAVVRASLSLVPQRVADVALSAQIDLRVFAFALISTVVTTVAFGITPALQAAREQPTLALTEASGSIAGGVGIRKVLVTAQIALALVLLVGAGLFVRTLGTLRARGPGFITTNQYFMQVDLARNGYSLPQSTLFLGTLLSRLRSLPDVASAAIGMAALLGGGSWNQSLTIAADQRTATERVHLNAVTPGYFETLGASSMSTTWLFVRETAAMLLVGIAIAFTIVSAVGRLVESELFGVKPLDGMTIAGAALLVAIVSLAAIAGPIRRAISISPFEALRSE